MLCDKKCSRYTGRGRPLINTLDAFFLLQVSLLRDSYRFRVIRTHEMTIKRVSVNLRVESDSYNLFMKCKCNNIERCLST